MDTPTMSLLRTMICWTLFWEAKEVITLCAESIITYQQGRFNPKLAEKFFAKDLRLRRDLGEERGRSPEVEQAWRMMGGPSQRRSWADLAEGELRAEAADLQWEDVLGRGPMERVALSDSEDYPDSDVPESPPQGKGKSVMETAVCSGPGREVPAVAPCAASGTAGPGGFFQVRSRRCDRRHSPPRSPPRPVPPELEGLCFNCLQPGHVKAQCRARPRCYNCWGEGHHAASCPLPRSSAVGVKRGRSPRRSGDARRVAPRRPDGARHWPNSADTVSGGSLSAGRSTSLPYCCRHPSPPAAPSPPPPPPPPVFQPAAGTSSKFDRGSRNLADPAIRDPRAPTVVIPRSTEIQAAEDALELALVGLVGGTRPVVSTATVYNFLYSEFELTMNDVQLRRHHPEDFIARFRRRADRDRVLASRPGGYLLPLTWRPWQRTSLATAESFNFQVVVGMLRVPLHARNVATAQIILGPSCSGIEITRLRDIPDDDDREFFVKAWCKHPDLIEDEQTISIPEPVLPVAAMGNPAPPRLLQYQVGEFRCPCAPEVVARHTDVDGTRKESVEAPERWEMMSAPRTPWTRASNFTTVNTPSPWIDRQLGSPTTGVVARFLNVAPLLLHVGVSTLEPVHVDQDWWADLAVNELSNDVSAQACVGQEGATSGSTSNSVDWWADLIEAELVSTTYVAASPVVDGAGLHEEDESAVEEPVSVVDAANDVATVMDAAAATQAALEAEVCVPMHTPLIRAGPRPRRARTPVSIPSLRRSGRIAARPRAPNATVQAQLLLLKKLGVTVAEGEHASEVEKKIKLAFRGDMSTRKREALQLFLENGIDLTTVDLNLHGLEDAAL
ncbi:unnamed protein product [Miscanthus lutarioriparius]|uniref:CCHC-type domain-containing protein n=1 Tax=Miscanthus lutarioriparius TaxID=422564 RepID=A0A811NKR6_9POAL|nr:unnamed protein product [Miscanthus lutarioriparius]